MAAQRQVYTSEEVLALLEQQEDVADNAEDTGLDEESNDDEGIPEGDFLDESDNLVDDSLLVPSSASVLASMVSDCADPVQRNSILLLDSDLDDEIDTGDKNDCSSDSESEISGRGHGQGSQHGRSSGCGQSRGRSQRRGRGSGTKGRRRGRGRGCTAHSQSTTNTMIWTSSRKSDSGPAPIGFHGDLPGPLNEARGARDPSHCFQLFIGDFIDELVRQSNIYANQQRASSGDSSQFTPFDKEEMLAFIGVNIAMGIVSLPSLNDYWSTDIITSHPWFRTVMSRDRFRSMLRYIHVADNSKAPKRDDSFFDKLWKIQPLLDFVSERCTRLYSPHPQISIDESMIGTKCRLSFIQYLPKKPVKWGIKIWVCADSVNGYICAFDVYCGANSGELPHANGLAYGVVMKLLQQYLNKGYTLYVDNFYASPLLVQDLLQHQTLCTGTLRVNRKNFPDILKRKPSQQMNRGDSRFAYSGKITVVHWKDTKDVYVISTAYSDAMTSVKRRLDKIATDVSCPYMIHDYNTFMGGVDLADQVMCYYSVGRKSMKWWRRVLWRMIDHLHYKCLCHIFSK